MQVTLVQLRHKEGLTQKALADICSVSRPLIAMIEIGQVRPYPKIRRSIADALGVLPADIWPDLEAGVS